MAPKAKDRKKEPDEVLTRIAIVSADRQVSCQRSRGAVEIGGAAGAGPLDWMGRLTDSIAACLQVQAQKVQAGMQEELSRRQSR